MATEADNIHKLAPSWNARQVVTFNGQHDTRITTGGEYDTRTLASLFALEPGNADKLDGLAFIPSSYSAHDARSHATQRSDGVFVALCGDVDHGDHPLHRIESMVRGFARDAAWLIFSTAHARADDKRWRIVIPLAQPIGFDDWHDAQHAFFNFMEYGGIDMDRALDRAGQPVYLPNVPDHHAKTGELLRDDDGAPLFYKRATTGTNAPGLTTDGPLASGMAAIARKREDDEAERKQMREEAARRRANRPRNDDAPIMEEFNRGTPVANLLELYGYKQSPRNPADWRSPHQQSDSYATRIVEDSWISLSASDVASGLGQKCQAGCFGDAYDLFVHFEHSGDHKSAFRTLYQERRAAQPQPYSAPPAMHPDDPGICAEDIDSMNAVGGEVFDQPEAVIDEADYPDPVDLWARYDPAVLPRGLLPDVIEKYAESQAELMGVDPGGIAMSALAVCSAVISDRICVQVKQHDPSWKESARLWVALIGPPSAKKTPIMSAATRPLNRLDAQLFAEYMVKLDAYDEDQARKKTEREGIQKPLQRRLRISDATVEAAQEVMKGSPDGILSVQDELSGWFGAMDKYGSAKGAAGDRAFWLQAFNGGEYALNRVARGAALIPNLSISVLGGIQPEPLRRLVGESVDDGLVQRLLPIPLHQASVGIDAPRSGEVEAYEQLVVDMWQLRPHDHGAEAMRFDPLAQEIRRELEERHHEMMSTEVISPKMASHFGKYDGIFARLCVLWHCIEAQGLPCAPSVITAATAARVAKFMHEYIAPNAVAFYCGMLGLADDHETLVDLAAHIVTHKLDTVNSRVIQRAGRALRSLTSDDSRKLCEKLESMGWLIEAGPAARSNTPRWAVNPIVHSRFVERSAKEEARRAKAQAAIKDAIAMSAKGAGDE
ncbi:hypothetical protein FHS51_001071 [Sphingobium wenxiniae]|uniref:Uncharacterized protein DUF3987 n=1 Tax=Sphingobium wenxiniae (strain DSM 21828 / CGMCC 1.7748 / JZ-1) TaxID=595605 RepID=A0A562KEI3_SPHWJ|nr:MULTISPECIES: DUF3987 domain-containing protein [Sphingomonadaceae]MBB6190851.1 hypothetical protein [Sphingobium wenxiniae]TWH93839.1 uncharacterized protein DUF3987 [Sphingobium wenxiniae]UNK78078.1 DUF3987 domain-containing protein [Sphingopyxis granuli]